MTADQIEDGIYPTVTAEVGRSYGISPDISLRPFAEAQVGIESFVRIGGDLVIGHFGTGAVMARDGASGQRYSVVQSNVDQGISFVLGGDMTRVFASKLLPEGGDAQLLTDQSRIRAGLHWQGEKAKALLWCQLPRARV